MSITIDCKDAWRGVVQEVARQDWSYLCTTLSCVSRSARSAALEHIERCVLPLMERICSPSLEITVEQRYHKYRGELERKISIKDRYWQRPLHLCIKNLLNSIHTDGYQVEWEKWQHLLATRVNLEATSSGGATALLLVCDCLCSLFSKKLIGEVLHAAHGRLLELLKGLLLAGADPNHQGNPSTPLVTILSQQPYSSDDGRLMYTMIELLLAYKADPQLIPTKDRYQLGKSPCQLAEKYSIIYPLFQKS